MKCPGCSGIKTRTLETRCYDGRTTMRRHECAECKGRWTTEQVIRKGTFIATTASTPLAHRQSSPRPPAVVPVPPLCNPPSGALSGSSLGLSAFGSDAGARSTSRARWSADQWFRKFGQLWAAKYKRLAYGLGGIIDGKATGDLQDTLDGLPEAEALAAQERAAEMIAEFLGDVSPKVVSARHPWSWFVTRFNTARVPAQGAGVERATADYVAEETAERDRKRRMAQLEADEAAKTRAALEAR